MAFTVQNDTGTQAGANAYITVAEFKTRHDDRGQSYGSSTDPTIEKAIILATDYVDNRWRGQFKGEALEDEQTTEWPRACVYNDRGVEVEGVPDNLKAAVAEYALRAITGPLLVDAPRGSADGEPTPTGRVTAMEQTVGPVSQSFSYEAGVSQPGSGMVSGDLLPQIPAADLLMQPLLNVSGQRKAIR